MAGHAAADHDCIQETRLAGMEREIGTLNDKVWRGNGKPALTEQIAVQAQTVRALCWLVAVTCAAVIAQIVAMIFKARGA
jgi:hypothetical protein